MFSFLDYSGLQHYWWILVSLLGALLVFLLFVQGGQSLIYTLASNEKENDASEFYRKKMGNYLYHFGYIWWCIFCFVSVVLFY
jgi:succinate dehydrogenase/fumarate reductase cytochrome b subunit